MYFAAGRGRGFDEHGRDGRRGYGREDYGYSDRDKFGRYGRDGASHRSVHDERERDRYSGSARYSDTDRSSRGDRYADMYAGAASSMTDMWAGKSTWMDLIGGGNVGAFGGNMGGAFPPGMLPPTGASLHMHTHIHT